MTRIIGFLIGVYLSIFIPCHGDTIHVPGDYPSIQSGIDAASTGDTVLVDPGIYVENIDFKGKAVSVKSDDGPAVTIIDGDSYRSVVTFESGEGPSSALEGFTITNGAGNYREYLPELYGFVGGGIYCDFSSPTIKNNVIVDNLATFGGGISCTQASPVFTGNTVCENRAFDCGGGIRCADHSDPTFIDTAITENTCEENGGGIHCVSFSSPTFVECTIFGNTSRIDGGGIYCGEASPTFTDSVISGNSCPDFGGGIYGLKNSILTLVKTDITQNTASTGGGIYGYINTLTLTECSFIANKAIQLSYFTGFGGGLFTFWGDLTVVDCEFTENFASQSGGGMHFQMSTSKMTGCRIGENRADLRGGGISCVHGTQKLTNCTVVGNSADQAGGAINSRYNKMALNNCMLIGNTVYNGPGGGIYNDTTNSPSIMNCTFCMNSASLNGGAMAGDEEGTVTNSIFWNNRPKQITGSSYDLSHCDIQGGWPGTGNIDSDPLFVNEVDGDFHLTFNSPCRATGSSSCPGLLPCDIEGDPRRTFGTVDIGADEFFTHLYCTGNATPGGNIQIDLVGLPGVSALSLFCGSGVLDPPVPTMYGNWFLDSPLFGPIYLPPIPSGGVLVFPVTLPAWLTAPCDLPMQALVGNELTNLYVLEIR